MWSEVNSEVSLNAYVNQRETAPSHYKMSRYNGSKVYNIQLFQSLEPYNDILEHLLPPAESDTGKIVF